nr:hybrid signal transduction histidine kinase M [Tanacetum cinerariifolium]
MTGPDTTLTSNSLRKTLWLRIIISLRGHRLSLTLTIEIMGHGSFSLSNCTLPMMWTNTYVALAPKVVRVLRHLSHPKSSKLTRLFFRRSSSLSPIHSKHDVVHYALEGLPEIYNQVCGYMHWKDTFLDLKTVHSLLITEEMRLKSRAFALPVDSTSPMVLVAESGNNWRPSSTPQVKSWRHCFNFAKGTCCFGDSCRYVHNANARVGTSNSGD